MSQRLQIGERIGEYEIVGFLGAGGMGSVYHGIHKKINRSAAIKILAESAASSNFKERFFNEARLQSSLHHPNIATLYDFQESGDVLFIVMEYVDGETLDALISRRYFAVEDALDTFGSVCDAVSFIHGNNIVHRDIKPQNIKLASNGMVKLLDFGIAKGAVSHGLTRIGGVIGTPNYLAPEQLLGQPATPRSDIWALGVLLYEMLTGSAPFQGQTLGELHLQITTSRYDPPEKLNTAVSADVSKIVGRCLTTDPADRYQSVAEILSDVESAKRRFQPAAGNEQGKPAFPRNALFKLANRESHSGLNPVSGKTEYDGDARASQLSRVAIASAIGLVVLFLVGIGVWTTSGPADGAKSNSSETAGTASTPQTVPTAAKQTGPAVKTQQYVAAGTDRPRLRLETAEGNADVFRDGKYLGTTPLEIEGAENETVELTFKKSGYEDKLEKIDITTRRKVYTVYLKRKLN